MTSGDAGGRTDKGTGTQADHEKNLGRIEVRNWGKASSNHSQGTLLEGGDLTGVGFWWKEGLAKSEELRKWHEWLRFAKGAAWRERGGQDYEPGTSPPIYTAYGIGGGAKNAR